MKTDKELLQLILDNIKEGFSNPDYNCDGLCLVVLFIIDEITLDERMKLNTYLKKYLPRHKKDDYCWIPGKLEPRIKWLNEQINKL